jgi:hypothetical protein
MGGVGEHDDSAAQNPAESDAEHPPNGMRKHFWDIACGAGRADFGDMGP